MKLNQMAAEVHNNAIEHGWWDEEKTFPEIIALIHSEVSEALEEYRKVCSETEIYYTGNKCAESGGLCVSDAPDVMCEYPYDPRLCDSYVIGKPEGIPIELADVIIRILDYCAFAGIDIEEAIQIKHEYNKTRPYKHGGKRM